MGKKSKKKTVASTKKNEGQEEQKLPKNGKLKKLIKKIKTKKGEILKSNNKEKIAEPAKKTPEESQKGESLNVSAEPKDQKLVTVDRHKLKAAALLIVAACAVVFIGVLLFQKIFRPEYLAEILPADTTVGFVEINIDPNSRQVQQFYKTMENYPVYQKAQLIGLLNVILPAPYEQEIAPWVGRKVGLALIKSINPDGKLNPILLIEAKDSKAAIAFFKSKMVAKTGDELLQENVNGYNVYHYKNGQDLSFTFFNRYLVVATSYQFLKDFVLEKSKSNLALSSEVNFRKVANNLPVSGLAFGYVNVPKLFEVLIKNPVFISRKNQEFIMLQPFLKIFSAEGISVFAENKEFHVQVFSAINKAELNGNAYLTYSDRYDGKLLQLANENPILMVGGHDLHKELGRMEDLFKVGTKANSVIIDGALEYQKEKYFGKDISLEEDIYPLLKSEYLLTVNKNFEEPEYNLFFELNDKNTDLLRVEKIVNAFVKMSAVFEPKIQDVTLPDGTKGQEIIASPEQITRSDSVYNGLNISTIAIGNKGFAIHYTAINNDLAASTNLDSLKQAIDRSQGQNKSNLKNSELYKNSIKSISRSADQVSHLNLAAVFAAFDWNNNQMFNSYLAPFGTISAAKNFFDDGIADLYLVKIL